MPGTRHFYFLDSIGQGDWFSYGTTLQDIRYAVEGYGFFDGAECPADALPEEVIFHYPACYGGEVWEGYAIYNYKRSLSARGVKTTSLVEGLCASIATLTAMGSDTVLMADAAMWMVHKPHVDAFGANADELVACTVLLNKIQDQLAGRYVARAGGKLDSAAAHALINRTSWLTADECLNYGFITGKTADAPLAAPQGAEKVLNYLSKTALKPAAPMAMSPKEEETLLQKIGSIFGLSPKNAAQKPAASTKPRAEGAAPAVAPAAPAAEPAPVNAAMGTEFPLNDGTSVFVDTSDDGVDDIDVDDAVYTDEALTTPCADATYTLEDGRDFTVTGGIVTAIDEAVDTAAAAPKAPAQNRAKAAAPKASSPAARLKVAEARAARAEAALAAHVPGSTGSPNQPGSQTFAGTDGAAPHPLDADAARAKNKLKGRA